MICSGVKNFLAMPIPFQSVSPILRLESLSGDRSLGLGDVAVLTLLFLYSRLLNVERIVSSL